MSLLAIRTSSMGDVIMTLPVIRAFSETYPEEELVLLTKKPFDLFFNDIPGVKIVIAYHHGRHKGFPGLLRLFIDLRRQYKITAVIDLHDVLRSKVIRNLFAIAGCSVAKINKGRIEKKLLINGKIRKPLTHTVERYADVFKRAGYPLKLSAGPWLLPSSVSLEKIVTVLPEQGVKLVGIAPLAKHKLKMWPAEKMAAFLKTLGTYGNIKVFLFGSPDEASVLNGFTTDLTDSFVVAGHFHLAEEIALISKLDVMIAMDSSNMHLASVLGVPTVSVWGGTHPWAGFSAWGSDPGNIVQISEKELDCRPCTIFGKGECRRGDLACMNNIEPEALLKKILLILKK